jgi:uncharacterized delta-60 repeat protein
MTMHLVARRALRHALVVAAATAAALTPAAASAAAGDLDPSFGTGGKRTPPGTEQPLDVFVQPDGKIVEVGGRDVGITGFLVRRFNPDGSPDKSFDGNGAATARFPNLSGNVDAAGSALQPDGAIVVAGNSDSAGVAVARFLPDGSLDPTFGAGGADGDGRVVISNMQTGFRVNDLVLQPGGKIALAGTQGNVTDIAVRRLRSDGSEDGTTYDRGDFDNQSDFATAAVQAPDGTLAVVGTTPTATSTVAGVVRYRPDGELDTSLGGTGEVKVPSIEQPAAALIQPDGKLLIAGATGKEPSRAVITRLTTSGEVDKTFGNEGTAEISDEDRNDAPYSIAFQPDGKVVVDGASGATAENATYEVWVARFDADGHPDPSYGAGGRASFELAEVALGGPIAVQPDGRVVAAAYTISSLVPRPVLLRLLADPVPGPVEQPAPEPQPEPQPEPKPDGPVNVPRDTTAPRLTGLRVVTKRAGREVRFKLSEPARVRFAVQRAPRHGRPRAVSGSFSIAAAPGPNRSDITRRSIVKRLPPGRYRLLASPTDASGNKGAATRADFTLKAKKKTKK